MASESAVSRAGTVSTEPNEHDYAHAGASSATAVEVAAPSANGVLTVAARFGADAHDSQVRATLTVELAGPAVGAEVDCPPVGSEAGASSPPQAEEEGEEEEEEPRRSSAPRPVAGLAPPARSRCGRRRNPLPEDKNCACCRVLFERQGRSFNRRAVYTFTTPDTVQWAFPDAAVHDKSFLCETCAQVVRSKCKKKQSGKRSLWLRPPVTKQSDLRDKKKKVRRMGKKSKAALLVSKSCYKAAFKMLWSAKGARKPMMEFWSKQLKEEMKALTRQADSPFHLKVSSRKPLSSFPWRRCLNWARDRAPLVTTCLTALFPDVNALTKSSHQMSEEQAQTLLERRAVVALSVPLFTRNIWKNNFLQAALGAELRLQGCSGSALDALNTMGLCQNKDTVRLLLHRLRSKKSLGQNGQRIKTKQGLLKGEPEMPDVEEEEEEEDEEEIEGGDVVEDDEDEEEEEEDLMDIAEEEEEEEEEEEDDDQVLKEKTELEKKRKKKAKRKQDRSKRKEREEEQEDEQENEEQKKKRVVVVRLDLLKGHSEVGRSDLSAP